MCSLFLVLRTLSTTAVRFTKKKTHQRLLLWEVSVMQQRPDPLHIRRYDIEPAACARRQDPGDRHRQPEAPELAQGCGHTGRSRPQRARSLHRPGVVVLAATPKSRHPGQGLAQHFGNAQSQGSPRRLRLEISPSTPEAVADYARDERAKWIKSSNIKLDCLPLTQHPKPSWKISRGLCFMSLDQRFVIVRRPPPIDATQSCKQACQYN